MLLDQKAAVITGSASGIGRAIARTFARHGAIVAIADIDYDGAQRVAANLNGDGGQAMAIAMDVVSEAQVNDGMTRVAETYGQIDVLVSNAGIQIIAPLEDLQFADWKRLLAIHLDGAFLTARAALRHMYRQGRGSIIYLGSVHSK